MMGRFQALQGLSMRESLIVMLLLGAACVGRAQTCVPLAPDATDGVIAAPEYHKVIYEDADVRVIDVVNPPHTVEEMHTHIRPSVLIILEEHPHYIYGFTPDGKRMDAPLGHPPYALNLKPNPLHRIDNPSNGTDHAVRVELKHPGCGPAPAPLSPKDALVADPAHTRLDFETDDIRVLEITLPGHTREAFHADTWPAIAYIDQPARVRDFIGDGMPTAARDSGKGVVRMTAEGLHAIENVSDTPLHLFRIELKHALPASTIAGQ